MRMDLELSLTLCFLSLQKARELFRKKSWEWIWLCRQINLLLNSK